MTKKKSLDEFESAKVFMQTVTRSFLGRDAQEGASNDICSSFEDSGTYPTWDNPRSNS